jgi:hypothetical protein
VTPANFLDIRLFLPHPTAERFFPTYIDLRQVVVFIPLTIEFPNIDGKLAHALLQLQISNSTEFNEVTYFGRLVIDQQRVFAENESYSQSGIEQLLSREVSMNATEGITLAGIQRAFEKGPITVKTAKVSQRVNRVGTSKDVQIRVALRIPGIFATIEAPFWNMFKVTYVQYFYWFWLVWFVWTLFIRTGFKYGVIPSSVRYPLKNSKQHAD